MKWNNENNNFVKYVALPPHPPIVLPSVSILPFRPFFLISFLQRNTYPYALVLIKYSLFSQAPPCFFHRVSTQPQNILCPFFFFFHLSLFFFLLWPSRIQMNSHPRTNLNIPRQRKKLIFFARKLFSPPFQNFCGSRKQKLSRAMKILIFTFVLKPRLVLIVFIA